MEQQESDNSENTEQVEEDIKLPSKGWNKILYGPPGTGKTYSINEYKEKLISGQTLSHSIVNFDSFTWKETILLAMKMLLTRLSRTSLRNNYQMKTSL